MKKRVLIYSLVALLLASACILWFWHRPLQEGAPIQLWALDEPALVLQAFGDVEPELDADSVYSYGDSYLVVAKTRRNEVAAGTEIVAVLMEVNNGKGSVLAKASCDAPMTPGFSAGVMRLGKEAIVFGALSDAFTVMEAGDLVKIPVDTVDIKAISESGTETVGTANSNKCYALAVSGEALLQDIQYLKEGKVVVLYSDYFGKPE